MSHYTFVPNVQCSFPVKCQPSYFSIRPGMEDWAATLDKLNAERRKRLAAEKWVLATCILIPTATDARIENVCKLTCWCFHFDDIADDLQGLGVDLEGAKRLVSSYLGIIQAAEPVTHKEFSQFCALWNDLRADMPPKQYQRLANRVAELLEASVNQVKQRNLKPVMSLEELLAHRRLVVGVLVMGTLMEYGIGIELRDDAVSNPDLQEAERLVADHVSCVNDLFCFLFDSATGDIQFNLVHNIMHNSENSKSSSFEEAAAKVHEMLQGFEHRFKKLWDEIRKSSCYNHAVEAYFEGLSYLISGNLEWHYQTGRYQLGLS